MTNMLCYVGVRAHQECPLATRWVGVLEHDHYDPEQDLEHRQDSLEAHAGIDTFGRQQLKGHLTILQLGDGQF